MNVRPGDEATIHHQPDIHVIANYNTKGDW